MHNFYFPSPITRSDILAHWWTGSLRWVIHQMKIWECGLLRKSQGCWMQPANAALPFSISTLLFEQHTFSLFLAIKQSRGLFPSRICLTPLQCSISTSTPITMHSRWLFNNNCMIVRQVVGEGMEQGVQVSQLHSIIPVFTHQLSPFLVVSLTIWAPPLCLHFCVHPLHLHSHLCPLLLCSLLHPLLPCSLLHLFPPCSLLCLLSTSTSLTTCLAQKNAPSTDSTHPELQGMDGMEHRLQSTCQLQDSGIWLVCWFTSKTCWWHYFLVDPFIGLLGAIQYVCLQLLPSRHFFPCMQNVTLPVHV